MTSLEEVSIKDVTKDQWKDTVGQPEDAETKTWPCLTAPTPSLVPTEPRDVT